MAIRIYDSLPILTFSLWVSNSDQDDLFTRAMCGYAEQSGVSEIGPLGESLLIAASPH